MSRGVRVLKIVNPWLSTQCFEKEDRSDANAVLPVYRFYGEPCRVGLYNHRQGHTIPPLAEQRVYEWLETYL